MGARQIAPNIFLFYFVLGQSCYTSRRPPLNQNIQKLADTLPNVIKAALAPSTNNKYERAWCQWKAFCFQNPGIVTRPADPFYIAIYFNFILTTRNSRGAITDAYFGIRWGHHSAGYYSPTTHPFVKLAYEGAKRLANTRGRNKKDPMTAVMIRKLFSVYGRDDNLSSKRFLLICILGFTGFMRTSELLGIKVRHISIHPTHMAIYIPSSKTDQLGDGNTILISRIESLCCPVATVEKYIKLANLSANDYLVCKLVFTKKGYRVVGSHGLSYSRTRAVFLKFTKSLFPGHNLGLHGLRAGGASMSASNNTSDRLISKHGRWLSEKARDGYIRPTLNEKLFVTRNLGL